MVYRPAAEVASRIATQLKKLGIGLAAVYGKDSVDDECYRVMKKVAFDSCIGWKFELVQLISRSRDNGFDAKTLADRMNISITQVKNIVSDCMQLDLVRAKKTKNLASRGRRSTVYILTDRIVEMMEAADISFKGEEQIKTPSNKTKKRRKTWRKK